MQCTKIFNLLSRVTCHLPKTYRRLNHSLLVVHQVNHRTTSLGIISAGPPRLLSSQVTLHSVLSQIKPFTDIALIPLSLVRLCYKVLAERAEAGISTCRIPSFLWTTPRDRYWFQCRSCSSEKDVSYRLDARNAKEK